MHKKRKLPAQLLRIKRTPGPMREYGIEWDSDQVSIVQDSVLKKKVKKTVRF